MKSLYALKLSIYKQIEGAETELTVWLSKRYVFEIFEKNAQLEKYYYKYYYTLPLPSFTLLKAK